MNTSPNISRTHPIWMFINRNYSINNPVMATTYDSKGLTLTFGTPGLNFLESSIYIQTVEYDCAPGTK